MRYLLSALLGLLLPLNVWAAAEQLSNTHLETVINDRAKQAIMIHCNNTDAGDTPATGEVCETDDWSLPFDAYGYNRLTIDVKEWGAGSAIVKVWNCMRPLDRQWNDATTAPTSAATDSSKTSNIACEELTDGVTLDGTALRSWSPPQTAGQRAYGLVFVEIDPCTGVCNLRVSVNAGIE